MTLTSETKEKQGLTLYSFEELSGLASIQYSVAIAVLFVGSLYVWPNPHNYDRDHPAIIKQRTLSVMFVSVITPIFIFMFVADSDTDNNRDNIEIDKYEYDWYVWLGISFTSKKELLLSICCPLLLTGVLFLGPLLLMYLDDELPINKRNIDLLLRYELVDPCNLRTWIVAPVSEEWIFRACLFSLLKPSLGKCAFDIG